MKKQFLLPAFLFALLNCVQLGAQSPTLLYGLSNGPSTGFYLASMDPANGAVVEISSQPVATTVVACYATIDPVNDVYYFSNVDSLIGVNTTNGNIVSRVAFGLQPGAYFEMPQYNCRDSLIYGLYSIAVGQTGTLRLATVNPATGAISIISPSSVDSGFVASTRGSLDPSAGIFYFHGISGYKGIDISTGQLIYNCNPVFTGPGTAFEYSLWDCEDSLLFGLVSDPSTGTLIPAVMNMQNGVITNSTSTGITTGGYYMCTAEINPPVDLFHYSDVNGFRTFNMTTGNVIASVPLTFSPVNGTLYFDWIARDNCKCFLSPVGANETQAVAPITLVQNPVISGQTAFLQTGPRNEAGVLQIFDALGLLIGQQNYQAGASFVEINTSILTSGYYFIRTEKSAAIALLVLPQ
jgi:hypothetical protein